jgi:hypothetical protein
MTGFGHQPFLVYLRVNDRIHEENHIDSVGIAAAGDLMRSFSGGPHAGRIGQRP